MTAQDDPYVRVYYRALRDEKFQSLTNAAWGHWVRLLVIADGMHPASAPLPRWTEEAALSELVAANIVDMDGAEFYRIHGLEAERAQRSELAAIGGKARTSGAQRDASGRLLPSSGLPARSSLSEPLLSAPIRTEPLPAPAAAGAATNGSIKNDERRLVGGFTAEERALMAKVATEALERKEAETPKKPRPAKAPPEDEETIAKCKAILEDPTTPDWKREAAREQLVVMGVPA